MEEAELDRMLVRSQLWVSHIFVVDADTDTERWLPQAFFGRVTQRLTSEAAELFSDGDARYWVQPDGYTGTLSVKASRIFRTESEARVDAMLWAVEETEKARATTTMKGETHE